MLKNIERQIRLYQLGYYNKNTRKEITNDDFDGKLGPNFKKALTWFQKDNKIKVDGSYGPESDKTLINVYNKFMNEPINWNDKVLVNFKESEFKCKCCGVNKIIKQEVYNMQALRHYLGVPVNISSAYRCSKHNTEVGGSTTSRHKNGKAVDFGSTKTLSLSQRQSIINFWVENMPNARHGYCNKYRNLSGKKSTPSVPSMGTVTHVDID